MKFTWGHGITIAIVLFMTFIVYIVIQTFQLNADLVRDDFYEQEVHFDDKKKMIENYQNLSDKITIEKIESGVNITYPESPDEISGDILFYRRDDKRLDKTFKINLSENRAQLLQYSEFLEGKYDISIKFNDQDKGYLFQSTILF